MGMPIIIVASGGLPVTEATNGYGTPVTIATNGYGTPVTIVASGGFPVVGSGGGGVATTLDPAQKSTFITLSNGNLTATLNSGATSTFRSVGSTVSKSSGKFYYEAVSASGATSSIAGLTNSVGFTGAVDDFIGNSTGSVGWVTDGRVLINGATVVTIQTFTLGDTVCVATDLTNSKIWFRTNGGNWNNDVIGNQNPATNTGGVNISGLTAGPYFPALSMFSVAGNAWTINFGNTAYAQTAPSGFGNWA